MKEKPASRQLPGPKNHGTDGSAAPETTLWPDEIGDSPVSIRVELSARFLEHFSEHMYSSPQKAFEELISNGWDAGADLVDVRISTDLTNEHATMAVFDNGESMDEGGLRQLWHIAFSPKTGEPIRNGRAVIGKFGLGKLATYVLARKLTYICKASDGVVRRVTMDYGAIGSQTGADPEKLFSELELQIFRVEERDVAKAISGIGGGREILELVKGTSAAPPASDPDEFGAEAVQFVRPPAGTWTLVVLSDLKPTGRDIKLGVLRRMLEAALPIGSAMSIFINGVRLESSKVDATILKSWQIGPDLGIVEVILGGADGDEDDDVDDGPEDSDASAPASTEPGGAERVRRERIPIASSNHPVPHVNVPGVGKVTGHISLFQDVICGGKSDEWA